MELQELHDKMWTAFEALKKTDAESQKEVKQHGETLGLTKEKLDKIQADLDAHEKKQEKILADLERKLLNPSQAAEQNMQAVLHRKEALRLFILRGEEAAKEYLTKNNVNQYHETKALSAGIDTAGGFLCSSEFEADLIKDIIEFSPIREYARIKTTTARSVKQPSKTGTLTGGWTAETGTRTETTGTAFGSEDISAHEQYAMVDISRQELEDSAINVESEIRTEASEKLGVLEGTAFVNGTGAAQPEGITVSTKVTGLTGTDTSGHLVTADDVVKMYYAIKEAYARNGVYFFKRAVIAKLRLLKEATTNAYIWQPGLVAGQPASLNGQPLREALDLLEDATAAGRKVGIFGDLRRGYKIVDRIGITMVRDDLTQAATGNVRFWVYRRVGGAVIQGAAICVLTTG